MNKLLIAGALLLSASYGFAMESSLSMKLDNSSNSNRADKNIMITASPVGVGPSMTLEQGGSLGVFLAPRTVLQLELGDGNTSTGGWYSFSDSTKTHTDSTSILLKQFVGNSFYLKGGLDYRRVNLTRRYSWYYDSLSPDPAEQKSNYNFNGTSYSMSFAIGNQWQWDNFTMGCDWFGVAAPISSTIKTESIYRSPGDTSSRNIRTDMEEDQNRFLKNVALQGLKFYLGASF